MTGAFLEGVADQSEFTLVAEPEDGLRRGFLFSFFRGFFFFRA